MVLCSMCHHSEPGDWRDRIEAEHDEKTTEDDVDEEEDEPAPDVELLTDGGEE